MQRFRWAGLVFIFGTACNSAPENAPITTAISVQALTPGRDLLPMSISGPPSILSGTGFQVTDRVCNDGDTATPPSEARLYLSTDAVITAADNFIGSRLLPPLFSTQCSEATTLVFASIPDGIYHLGIIADPFNSVVEGNESNNARAGGQIGVGARPDLIVSEVRAPAGAFSGAQIEVSATVCNQGQQPSANADVAIYASNTLLGTLFLNHTLYPGRCRSATGTVFAQPGSPFTDGWYVLRAVADPWNNQLELIETNNELLGPNINIGAGPDLRISALTAPPGAFQGQGINVSATLCNDGTTFAGFAEVAVYTSFDDVIDGSLNDTLLGFISFNAGLSPGSCGESAGFMPALPPSPFIDGSYRLGAIADRNSSIVELNETNNRFVGPRLNIGNGVDLLVTAISGPSSALSGQAITVDATVCNHGTQTAFSGEVRVYLSQNQVIDGISQQPWPSDDAFLGSIFINNSINAGACRVISGSVNAFQPAPFFDGSYYLGAIVDETNSIFELNEQNNEFTGGRMGMGNAADLVVSAISAPFSALSGQTIEVTATVCNRGTQTAFFAEVSLYLSEDTQIDGIFQAMWPSDDGYLGSVFLNQSLFPGQCRPATGNVWAATPPPFFDGPYYLGAIVDEFNSHFELDETNNKLIGAQMGIGNRPDLVITALSAPGGANPGQSVTVEATICNRGTQPTGGLNVSIYASADRDVESIFTANPPGADTFLGTVFWSETLFPGQCRTVAGAVSVFAPAPFTDGPYYLAAIADDSQAVFELNETNNIFVGDQIGIGSGPDLVITALSAPYSAQHGMGITVQATVCNRGTLGFGGGEVSFYTSLDTKIDSIWTSPSPGEDAFLGQAGIPSFIEPGRCAQASAFVPAFAGAPFTDGPYYLAAIADDGNDIFELNETNNRFVGAQIGIGNAPDLVVASITGPFSAQSGEQFTVQVNLCNRGTSWLFGAGAHIYLSADTQIDGIFNSPFPSDDQFLGSVFTSQGLNAGQCRVESVSVNGSLPAPFIEGPYYLAAIADETHNVSELNETNNVTVGATMGIGSAPDLVITALSAPPSGQNGQQIEVSAQVCNRGRAAAHFAEVTVYLSADTSIDGIFQSPFPSNDAFLGSIFGNNTIFAGQCRAVTGMVTINAPAPFLDGAYFIGAMVDEFRSLHELDESNNEFVGGRIGVGSGPDLVVTALRAPAGAQQGGSIDVTATLCNFGTNPIGGAEATIFSSADTVIDNVFDGPPMSDDNFVGVLFTSNSFFPGQCRDVSGTFSAFAPAPFTDGAYYLGAIADAFESVFEINETNNIFLGPQLNIGSGPDLVVTAIEAPPSAQHGFAIEVKATVCNHGTSFSPAPQVFVYSSADAVIDGIFQGPGSDDMFLGTINLQNGIDAGECETGSEILPAIAGAPFTDGSYYLGAIVDESMTIFELNEANNERAIEKLAIGSGPDVVVTAITGPSSVQNGNNFTAQATVCNRGTTTLFSADIFVYLSADPVIDGIFQTPFPSDDFFAGTIHLSMALSPGQCRVESAMVVGSTPAPFVEGAYYLGAIADETNNVFELDETNNELAGARIGIGSSPDLVITAIEAPSAAQHSESIEVTATLCNRGTQTAHFAEISLYSSKDEVIEGIFQSPFPSDDAFLGFITLNNSLFPGQCRQVTGQVTATAGAPFTDGAYFIGAIADEFSSVFELDEENNEFLGGAIGIGSGPDLVVTAISGPPSANFGQQMTVRARVCNQGTQVTGGVQVSVYLSADTEIDGIFFGPGGDDGFLGSLFANDPLQPGACREISGDVFAFPGAPFTDGAYHLAAIADETGSIFELNEENNIFVGGLMGIGSRPDLVIRALTGPASAQHGNAMTVQATVCNDGTQFVPSAEVFVYISADTELDGIFNGPGPSDDSFLGTIFLSGGISAGSCVTGSQVFPAFAPWPALDGVYFLGGIVDETLTVSELNELNNTTIGQTIGIGNRPDLVVELINAPPSATPGQSVNVDVRLCNRGTVMSSGTSEVMLYTSADTVIDGIFQTPYPSPDRFLGTYAFPALAPNSCLTLPGSVSMFEAEPFIAGPYYLGAIVDEFNSQLELNESNNELTGPRIGIGFEADLVVTGISAPPSALPGATIAVEVELCNQGTVNVPFAEVMLYTSFDQQIDGIHGSFGPSEDLFLGILSAPGSINAGACVSVNGNVIASRPPPFFDGAYYLGAIADEFESVFELNEENNEFIGPQIGIGNGPDLVLSAVTSEPFVLPGGNFDVSSTACNFGTSFSSPTNITYYLSTDGVINSSDVMIGFGSVPSLNAGTCHNEQVLAWLPGVALGTYFVGAIVDPPSSIFELNESNNALAGDTVEVALHFCGNGSVDLAGEQCDDGNNVDGDGCTAACIDEICGDGVINNGGIEECDDGNLVNWDGCSSICERENPRFGEVGRVSINQPNRTTWRTVNLLRTYRNPVVIMEATSRGDAGFAHLRVRNVTSTSFQWQIEEWAYLDGVHGTETANYIVLEAGRRTLEDGTILEAGRTTTNQNFRVVNFSSAFPAAPVILTAVNTVVDTTPVITRTRNTNTTSFEVRVQEEEAQVQTHGTETISWLAIQSGNGMNAGQPFVAARTADVVTDAFFTINFPPIFSASPTLPVFIGHADRTDSTEPVALRWRNLTNTSVQVNMEEDDSSDAEHVHTTEAATYLAWGAPGFVTFQPSAAENPNCNDLLDNDGDLLVDCADPQCLHVAPCP